MFACYGLLLSFVNNKTSAFPIGKVYYRIVIPVFYKLSYNFIAEDACCIVCFKETIFIKKTRFTSEYVYLNVWICLKSNNFLSMYITVLRYLLT